MKALRLIAVGILSVLLVAAAAPNADDHETDRPPVDSLDVLWWQLGLCNWDSTEPPFDCIKFQRPFSEYLWKSDAKRSQLDRHYRWKMKVAIVAMFPVGTSRERTLESLGPYEWKNHNQSECFSTLTTRVDS